MTVAVAPPHPPGQWVADAGRDEGVELAPSDLHSRVVERIGRAVVSGRWPPGTVFRTEDLAADVGVSLSVAREAVRVVESLGLVTSRKRVGVRVLDPSLWLTLDPRVMRWQVSHEREQGPAGILGSLASVLLGLAPAAAAAAAVSASAEEVARIATAAVSLVAEPGADRLAALLSVVVDAAHDPVYTAVADLATSVDSLTALPAVGDPAGATNLAIAIQRGEPEAARQAMHVVVGIMSVPQQD